MHWLLLVISVVFALAAAATVAVPAEVPEAAAPSPPSAENAPKAQMLAAEMRKVADEQYKQCLNDWDAATHMTKGEWQRTCQRLANNRAKFRLEMGTGEKDRSPSQ